MAYDYYGAVAEFHRAAREPLFRELEVDLRYDFLLLRERLLMDEVWELQRELHRFRIGDSEDEVPAAMEAADVLYVVFGLLQLLEIPIHVVFDLIHQRNMAKIDPVTGVVLRRADGKILKPTGWTPVSQDDVRRAIVNYLNEHQRVVA